MHSLDINYLEALNFSPQQASSIQKIGEYRGKQELFSRQTPEVLESLQQIAMIESSESSNRLEGIIAPHDRIEALVLKSTAPKNRSEQEIAGYRDALALIHESAQYMDFSTNAILQYHSMLYRFMPEEGGKWKTLNNEIVERNPDGSIKKARFIPVPALETPGAMEALVTRYRQSVNEYRLEPLILIPLTILDFLCIHPFRDGNGRVSRLLTLLLLYHFDYQVGRFISLERIFEESKETYYETLEESSKNWHKAQHNAYPWMNYFWGVLISAYKEFEKRVGTIRTGRGSKTEQIRMAVNRKIKSFAISDIEEDCPGVSREMIRIVLRQLRDEEVITLRGKGRGSKWVRVKEVT